MDTDTLVENVIQDGRKIVDELPLRGFEIATALWLRASEDGKWYFYIVSPSVDTEGLAKAYRELHRLIRAMPQPLSIDLLGIKLIGPNDPIARDVLAIQSGPAMSRASTVRWGGKKLGNVSIEEAYLYPRPVTTP